MVVRTEGLLGDASSPVQSLTTSGLCAHYFFKANEYCFSKKALTNNPVSGL